MTPAWLIASLRSAVGGVVPRTVLVGEDVEPPCLVVVPPRLTWGGPGVDPTDAELVIALVVANGDRSAAELLGLVEATVAALDTCDNAIGQPSASHPCLHYVPIVPEPAAATPGRYSPQEEAPNQRVPSDL